MVAFIFKINLVNHLSFFYSTLFISISIVSGLSQTKSVWLQSGHPGPYNTKVKAVAASTKKTQSSNL
jgi:hypothetical protein